jgi:hypothetical protein
MRLMYQHASRVIAWLGNKTLGVELAFDFASTLVQLLNQLYREAPARLG